MKRLTGVLFGLVCAAWIVVLPFSILFAVAYFADRPATVDVWVLKANFLSFPVICLLATIAAWIAWQKGRRRIAWALAAAPVLWLVVPAIVWGLTR